MNSNDSQEKNTANLNFQANGESFINNVENESNNTMTMGTLQGCLYATPKQMTTVLNMQKQCIETIDFQNGSNPTNDDSFESIKGDEMQETYILLHNETNRNDEDSITESEVKNFVSDILTGKVTLDSNLVMSDSVDNSELSVNIIKMENDSSQNNDSDVNTENDSMNQPTCNICYLKFKSLCMLRRHKSSEHADNLLHCSNCNHGSKNLNELNQHKLIMHAEFKQYDCEICHVQFKHIYHLKTHMLIHNVDNLLSCGACNYKCADQSAMDTHNLTHIRNQTYSCNICDFHCSQKNMFERHKNVHSALMRFSCDVCPFKCRLPSKLRLHILEEHSGEKLYSCEVCTFRTKHVISLNRHRIVHTGEKPFECDICHFRCNRSSNLDKHKLRHKNNI